MKKKDCKGGSPCRNDGKCKTNGDTFICQCKEDFYGKYCEYKKNSNREINPNIEALYNSELLTENNMEDFFKLTEFKSKSWKLIYSGNRDSFESTKFHSMCDNTENTFSLIKSNFSGTCMH